MSRSTSQKEKYGNNTKSSRDNCEEGTSARTRPLSYYEIMSRRKNKIEAGEIKDDPVADQKTTREDMVEKDYYHVTIDRLKHDAPLPTSDLRRTSEVSPKLSSRNKEGNILLKEGKYANDKIKESRESEKTPKDIANKDVGDSRVMRGKTDRHASSAIKEKKQQSSDYFESDPRKKRSKISERKHGPIDKSEGKYPEERHRKEQNGKDKKQSYTKRKYVDHSSDDSENELKKSYSRGFVEKDKYVDRNRGISDRMGRAKHRSEEEKRDKTRNSGRSHDLVKSKNSEFSERKVEPVRVPHEESREKRRRSKSRDRDKDRSRKSRSHSPKAHKRLSHDIQEQGDLPSHSSKDKSGKSHSEDKKKLSSDDPSGSFRRNGGFASGLGGYSPRKRKTDVAIKTPSPTNRSPERRTAGWDIAPAGLESRLPDPILTNAQATSQAGLVQKVQEPVNVFPMSLVTAKPVGYSSQIHTMDSIQLTQATRPMRRLYVENLPDAASEKLVLEFLNRCLLSSGVSHIQGTQPCISCMIHKDKGQALLEFLTPEYASAALSFDGRFFLGSILKIRRPKDFVEVATGVPEKSAASVDSVCNIVEDSPHKIFVGGISETISSEMLLEIAKAFGSVRAYYFEFNPDLNARCAFLEYVDHSVTPKACAGLNGMMLGGRVITVVLALPDISTAENVGKSPLYRIPKHAKPLLKEPTKVLKLKNVLNPGELLSLSELELKEILEDVRLECARFGTVKSVNVVKHISSSTIPEMDEVMDNVACTINVHHMEFDDKINRRESLGQSSVSDLGNIKRSVSPDSTKEPEAYDKAEEEKRSIDDKSGMGPSDITIEAGDTGKDMDIDASNDKDDLTRDDMLVPTPYHEDEEAVEQTLTKKSPSISEEVPTELNKVGSVLNQLENKTKIDSSSPSTDPGEENKTLSNGNVKPEVDSQKPDVALEFDCSRGNTTDHPEKDENKGKNLPEDIFELGSVFVEFRRAEASCTAAHCLHGRLFDDRIVSVEYVAHDLYCTKFPK